MKRPGLTSLLFPAVLLAIAACGNRQTREPVTPVTQIPEQGGWFCQMSAAGSGWDCVQDPALARNPKPDRLPEPTPAEAPFDEPPAEPPADGPADAARQNPATAASTEATAADDGTLAQPPAVPGSEPEPAAADVGTSDTADSVEAQADFRSLAYQAESQASLTDLPADLYAVQLLAHADQAALDAFATDHGLEGLPSARVAREGEVYHVLLLGIYRTLADARRAIDTLPAAIDDVEPWIRPMGSLQQAIRQADELTQGGNLQAERSRLPVD